MLISIVIPCYNESLNISALYEKLKPVIDTLQFDTEIIFIDDGSTDSTLFELDKLKENNDITVLELSRNFGHQAALCAGLDYANGDAVIMMDADLQHPPELIPFLLEKWREGYEVVCTTRLDTCGVSVVKKLTSRLFYFLINLFGNLNLPKNSADFRLIDRKVALELKGMMERTKFIRGLVSWVGFKHCAVEYEAPKRHAGETKYALGKMLRFAFDGITSFSSFPLHISTFLGLIVSAFSFLYAMYAIGIRLFTNYALPGWTSVLVSVLFLGGVQLISLGVIGEYIDRIYTETKARPSYIIRNIYRKAIDHQRFRDR